jgi:2-polyprenyl-3-methyl-5-hydroxy-6-metoxy-1,4-benzoquinol methylase
MTGTHADEPQGTADLEALPLKAIDRYLQRWRFAEAKPYIARGARVLDIGCSDGALFRYLGNDLGSGVGIDPALRHPVDRDRYRLIRGRVPDDLPEGQIFDVVTMLAVVEHLPYRELEALRRGSSNALRPRGRLILTVPSPKVDRLLQWLERIGLVSGIGLHEHHGFDPTQVPRAFSGDGLRLVISRRFQFGLNNLFVFERGT